jgi:hypothetical protein|tara:strand:+ start:4395 stop:5060 length:666 start_codon:yes stop_codon:yes gene_type:complete
MGKVNISEPKKGEALTVTKINSTIASWTTQASNIDNENVHDQSLDNYNFADNSVRIIHNGSQENVLEKSHTLLVPKTLGPIKIVSTSPPFDMINHDQILRTSFHIYYFPDFPVGVNFDGAFLEFELSLSCSSQTGTISSLNSHIATRNIRYEGNQLKRQNFDETISIVTHLNKALPNKALGFTNLEIFCTLEIKGNTALHVRENTKCGVYGHFAEIETIKR